MRFRSLCFVLLLLALAGTPLRNAHAQSNGGAAVAIQASGIRVPYCTVTQPDSGALVVFADTRSGTADLYAQRLDRRGRPLLGASGALLMTFAPGDYLEAIMPDGAGGILIARSENRGATGKDIVLQRVLADGSKGYGATGLVICNATRDQTTPRLVPGPAGSYYVAWADDRLNLGGRFDIYLQRVSLAGAAQWGVNGVPIASPTMRPYSYGINGAVSDLLGGIILCWSPTGYGGQTRAQRVNSGGALQWGVDGVQFGDTDDSVYNFAPDGTGGVWGTTGTWDGTYAGVQAHRLLSTGASAFPVAGITFHSPSYQGTFQLKIVRDGTGGCFIYGMEYRQPSSPSRTVFRQQISAAGALLRGTDGESLFGSADFPMFLDAGTATVMAYPEVVSLDGRRKLRVQRYALDGTAFYAGAGIVIGRDEPNLDVQGCTLGMSSTGIIAAAWADGRYRSPTNSYNYQVFGQAITPAAAALWDDAEKPVIQTVRDAVNDQGGYARVTWNASIADDPAARTATGYRVWRALPGSLAVQFGGKAPAPETPFKVGDRTVMFAVNAFWEQAGQQAAVTLPSYALTVPTMQDSIAGAPADQSFMVEAFDDSSHHWFSGTLTGHSVDNLAPAAPTGAGGFFAGGATTLYWNSVDVADLGRYEVFRGSSPAFVPSDANRVTSTSEVSVVDAFGAPAYYRIAARDVHGNLGASALVVPAGTLDAGQDAPRAWALRSAWSAGRGSLELTLDVPQQDEGRIELFDVSGRRLWGTRYVADGARSLVFRAASAGLKPGLVYARATSANGRQAVAKTVVIQ